MKKNNLRLLAVAVSSLVFLLSSISAQESNISLQEEGTRIRFKRGRSSATIKGTVAKGGPDIYLVGGRAMQRMTVKATGKVSFGIDAPNAAMTSDDSNVNWSGELSAYGDYKIRVYSSGGVQNYSLTISIIPVSQNGGSQTSALESPACRGEQLSLREAEGESDMGGKRYGNYVFTNTSKTACTLAGYPKFVLLNRRGQILRNVKVKFTNDFAISGDAEVSQVSGASKIVKLAPGESAWFQIFYNNGMALEHKKPFPVAAKVRVTAPNTQRAFLINSEIEACCGVEVSAVRGGSPQ
jgi:hypothetical protein